MAGTMHLSPRDSFVYEFASECQWNGSVESPTGAFIAVTVADQDSSEYRGHYVLTEDDRGFVYVWQYSFEQMCSVLEQLKRGYLKWLDGHDEDIKPDERVPVHGLPKDAAMLQEMAEVYDWDN